MNQQRKGPLAKWGKVENSASCKPQTAEFNLVVAYDDFSNANFARTVVERLVESFGENLRFNPRFLKFEELSRPHVGERLAKEVAKANMVVIVAHEHADLPDLVDEWIRTRKTATTIEDRRLLAFISTSRQESNRWTPVQSRLRQAARRTGMRFVLQATPLSKTRCHVADAKPKAGRRGDERCETGRKFHGAGGSVESPARCAVSYGTSVNYQPTAISNAITDVMRSRQRKPCRLTMPLANGLCAPPPEMNRIPLFANL